IRAIDSISNTERVTNCPTAVLSKYFIRKLVRCLNNLSRKSLTISCPSQFAQYTKKNCEITSIKSTKNISPMNNKSPYWSFGSTYSSTVCFSKYGRSAAKTESKTDHTIIALNLLL